MEENLYLSTYNPNVYRTPDGLATDICIFTITSERKQSVRKSLPNQTLKILLIKRKQQPYQGKWALPGGFSKANESLYESAKNKLKEKTNIGDTFHLEQVKTIYYPGRDLRSNADYNEKVWIPTVIYCAFVKEESLSELEVGNNTEEIKLFSLEEAKDLDFAFDHDKIIFSGLQEICGEEVDVYKYIQNKMLSTTIAKNFLPKEFTLSELLQVIKAVVPDFHVENSNFIRKMLSTKSRKGIIEEVLDENNQVKKSNLHSNNAAKLYRFTDFSPTTSIYNSTLL